ncbi:TPA: efflux transporter outer membrane subunit [Klebsiella pneumoniae]
MKIKQSSSLTLVAWSLILLSGCSLQPEYHRPHMPVPGQWQEGQQGGETYASTDWKKFYRDQRVVNLIKLALENNRDLRVAALNVETAQARFRIERSALFPTIEVNMNKTAEHVPGNLYSTRSTGSETYQQYELSAGITSWELDFFGRIRSLRDNALETYLSTAATEKATRISLIASVASGYMSLAADHDLLRLALDTADSQKKTWSLTQQKYLGGNGIVSEQDVMQAEMSVRAAEADVKKYTRQLKQDENALSLLLGIPLPASARQNMTLEDFVGFPSLKSGIASDLLTRRPDIIAAEHTLKAANANIGAARAAFFPSISLTASGGTLSDSLGHLLEGGTAGWSFLPEINIPIFTGGKNKANLDVAELEKRIEIANYEKSIQQAFWEVSDALTGKQTYAKEVDARTRKLSANRRYYELALQRYKIGIDSHLNVLVAQRELYSSEEEMISVKLSSFQQDITLYKVLGGGW